MANNDSQYSTGKSNNRGGYIRRREEMLASPAYRDLKPPARCLLEEFQRKYRNNRCDLSISTNDAKELLNVSEPTACKAFHELSKHGFIVLTSGHLWQERLAREWRLTFEKYNGRQPTDEWRSWSPDRPFNSNGKIPTQKTGAESCVTY